MSESTEARTPPWPAAAMGLDYGAAIEAGQRALDQWTHGIFECGRELGLFALARGEEEVRNWGALANCRSAEEMIRCECDFVTKATADYTAESAKLWRLMLTAAGGGLQAGVPEPAAAEAEAPRLPARRRRGPAKETPHGD